MLHRKKKSYKHITLNLCSFPRFNQYAYVYMYILKLFKRNESAEREKIYRKGKRKKYELRVRAIDVNLAFLPCEPRNIQLKDIFALWKYDILKHKPNKTTHTHTHTHTQKYMSMHEKCIYIGISATLFYENNFFNLCFFSFFIFNHHKKHGNPDEFGRVQMVGTLM